MTVARQAGKYKGQNMNAGSRTASSLCLYVLLITISMTFSSHVSLKKVDQLCFVHFKFRLISSDTKLPKCYTIKQRGMSLITSAHMACCTKPQRLLHCTNPPVSADSLERTNMR